MATTAVRRVLHIEDSARMRQSLELAIDRTPDLAVIGAAPDGPEGVQLAGALHPDVIVLDQQMPTLDGLDALPMIRQVCPEARVVMWSNDPLMRDAAIEAGVAAFVDKAAPIDQLVSALRA
jgi:DNA-binding NarL/FixJ family response regulator